MSVVITTHNRKESASRLIESIMRSPSSSLQEIMLVDDASTDGTSKLQSIFPELRMLRLNKQVWPSSSRNKGARFQKTEYILFADDDIVIEDYSIELMVRFLENHRQYFAVGPVVTYLKQRNRIWHAGVAFRFGSLTEGHYIWHNLSLSDIKREGFIDCGFVPGVFMVRRKIFRKLKGFDALNFPISYEEADLALRARLLGYRTACLLHASALHDIGESSQGRVVGHLRAFHHGRSRTRFYIKYVRLKLIWLPGCFIGFAFKQLENRNVDLKVKVRTIFSYLRGIVHAIAGR